MNHPQHQSPVVIITGMHRSGTSLTAALLQSVGVNIGQRLVGSDYGNVRGHFENIDFVEFHKQVLQANHLDELGCVTQDCIQIEDQQIQQAQEILERNQDNEHPWGWKDPRTTLFLEFWHQLIPSAKFIFVYRSPWEVVDSLYRRATDSAILNQPELAIKTWQFYNHKILNFYSNFSENAILVNVYQVGQHPEQLIQEIQGKFEINLDVPQRGNFDRSLLKDDILQTNRPHLIKQCFPDVIDLYLQLEAIANPFDRGLTAAESEILNQSPSPNWMFKDWSEIRNIQRNQDRYQAQLDETIDRLIHTETELGQTQFKLEGLEVQYQEAKTKVLKIEQELGKSQLKLAGTEQKHQEAILKIIDLEQVLGKTQGELQGTELQLHDAVAKLISKEEELGQTQAEWEAINLRYQEVLGQCIQLENTLSQVQVKLVTLETELGQSQLKQRGAEAQFQEAKAKVLSLETELGNTQLALVQAQGEIEAIKASKFWKIRDKWTGLKRWVRQNLRPKYLFSIDSPTTWEFIRSGESFTQVEGWCLYTGKQTIQAVRAKVGNQVYPGNFGIERLDLVTLFPWIEVAGNAGFRVQIPLPERSESLHFEVQRSNGKWHRFATYPLQISSVKAAFDAPTIWQQRPGNVLFAGWCCHPKHQITQLLLKWNDNSVVCAYRLPRADVGAVLPEWPGSHTSGFEVLAELPPGKWDLQLEAQLDNGEIVTYPHPQPLVIKRDGIVEKIGRKGQQATKFIAAIRQRARERKQRLGRVIPMPWEIPAIIRQTRLIYRKTQAPAVMSLLPQGFQLPEIADPYEAWLKVNPWTLRREAALQQRLESYSETELVKISVIMPVYNPPIDCLEKAINSVIQQVYHNWELCIADDCSSKLEVTETLKKLAATDDRIKVVFRSENGNISAATNTAAELATGEFLLFLDNDDELTPDALAEIALYIAEHPETDVLYTDDDKIDTTEKRFAPQFKPDWSPHLLLSYMYMSHAFGVRRSLFQQVGGLRLGYEGSQDYDLALRTTELAHHIGHIPLVLYHWRAAPGSTAISGSEKPASFAAGCQAVQDALTRRNQEATAFQPKWAIDLHLGIFSHEFPDNGPTVTIIIPTKNQLKLLKACIESLQKTTYENYQILVIDNDSDEADILDYFQQLSQDDKITVFNLPSQDKFNFAALNNQAVETVETDYILFLNNDTEVISPNWLSQMMGYAKLEKVGAVGARLIYPDDRVQHAGIIHGLHHGLAGHAFKLTHKDDFGYLAYSKVLRNYSAVTAACLLTPRQLFLELGGFDPHQFGVAYNDADYGYRLTEQGYHCIYCPDAQLVHKEGTSRGFKDHPQEVASFRRKYADKIDSFYNPHLSLSNEWFQVQPRHFTTAKTATKPRVLMCSNALEYTGAPLHQYEIAVKLAKENKIEPVIFSVSDGLLRSAYEQHNIQVIVAEHPLINVYQQDAYETALQAFAEELQLHQYDVIYANTLENFFMVDCAEKIGIPSVWNIHESEPWQTYFDGFGSEIATQALNCFKYPYRIIFVADATRNLYLPLNSHHNFTVIHNGMDVKQFQQTAKTWTRNGAREALNLQETEMMILLLGTVCERKGQQDLIKALTQLPPEWYPRIRCFIVGDRPSLYSTELSQLVQQLPEALQTQITIVPETPETAKYYQAADLFVCTSRIESYPRVILEAMAYNLPIITTPVFGIPEQVRENINALFYTPNQPKELCNSLISLLENQAIRQEFAENAKFVLDSLNTFEEMTQAYCEIFQEADLINPHPRQFFTEEREGIEASVESQTQAIETPQIVEGVKPPIQPAENTTADKSYWETNPTAATASQWVSNPIIEEVLHQRMSGGQSKKYWLRWLIEDYFVGRKFDNLLSLGCGIGNHEILMAELEFAREIDAFDFSESSLKIAREAAKNASVNINFYQDDFNIFNLGNGKKYDIAFCSGSLHHVKELERFLEIVHRSLNPEGYFVINEYIGDIYCIYNQKQVNLINRLYRCFNEILKSGLREELINPTIHQVFATDPSEAVRSKLILPFVQYYFDIEVYNPFGGGILHPLYPLLDHHQLMEDTKGETIVRLLLEFEQILMEIPGGLESDFCLCIMRPKKM
jgi:GT2 family glycosyltransferase/glycosyltransferase involved in cell wall biosynthesis/ubiquinone/menaquinone biosynthesis C-methylase UbiE